jgi:hypothetical protein
MQTAVDPPQVEVREVVVDVDMEAHRPADMPEDDAAPKLAPESSGPFAPAIRIAPHGPSHEVSNSSPTERRKPTLADVRAWVAQGVASALEPSMAERPLTPAQAVTRPPAAPIPVMERAENYTLEIGTIQIVVEEPAVAPPQRPGPPAHPTTSAAPAWSDPSRYYLRP